MQNSIVHYSKVKSDSACVRIDAEFFKEEYLSIETFLRNKPHKDLQDFGIKIYHPSEIKREYTELGGALFLRAQNVRPLEVDLDSNRVYISLEDAKKLGRNQIQKADILITRTGANFGQCAIYLEKERSIASSHTFIVKSPCLNPFFLTVFLNTKCGRKLIDKGMYGASQPEIAPFYLYRIPVPIFRDDFYVLIERIYRKSFNFIKLSKDLYSQAEKVFISELGLLNWEPRYKMSFIGNYSDVKTADRIDSEYFQPMYDDLLEKVRHYRNGYKLLGDIVTIRKCIEPGSQAYEENGIPFLRVSNLSKFGIVNDNKQYISEELYEQLKSYQPEKGEILLSKDATPGIAYYLNKEPGNMIPSGGILRLKVKKDDKAIYPEYLTLVLNSVVVGKQIERDIGGSVINHWLVDQVKKTLIPILPESIQKDISDKVADSFMKHDQSVKLLDIAKRGVEMAIEKSEEEAEKWLNEEVNHAGSSIHLESR